MIEGKDAIQARNSGDLGKLPLLRLLTKVVVGARDPQDNEGILGSVSTYQPRYLTLQLYPKIQDRENAKLNEIVNPTLMRPLT